MQQFGFVFPRRCCRQPAAPGQGGSGAAVGSAASEGCAWDRVLLGKGLSTK